MLSLIFEFKLVFVEVVGSPNYRPFLLKA